VSTPVVRQIVHVLSLFLDPTRTDARLSWEDSDLVTSEVSGPCWCALGLPHRPQLPSLSGDHRGAAATLPGAT
jgi:hypothetical protein